MGAAPLVQVVDDEPEVRRLIFDILERAGYRTRALDSGTAALQLAPTEPPALICNWSSDPDKAFRADARHRTRPLPRDHEELPA